MEAARRLTCLRSLAIAGFFLASCAPAVQPTPTSRPAAAPAATATTAAPSPVGSPAAPAAKPTAPAATPKPAAEEPKYGGILSMSTTSDPASYDPIQESAIVSVALLMSSYSGILQHDPLEPNKVIGDLAERWEVSPDGKAYTFHLHKNVKWHDGKPFTSEDARFWAEAVRNPPGGVTSPRRAYLNAVDRIETPDKDTLRITIRYPSASFLRFLGEGRMGVAPKHVYEAKGNMKRDIVGTGPYKFKSHEAGVSFNTVKNPDYFIKGRPYLDGITWYIISDAATRFAALRTGRVEMTGLAAASLTPSQAEIARKEMGDTIIVDKYGALSALALFMVQSRPPWNDVRLRRAVDLTIDRAKVIKVGLEGVGDIVGYMPPGQWSLPQEELMRMPGYRQPKDADIAEAKRLMAEAGYAAGMKITTPGRNSQEYEYALASLKEQLRQIGIDMTVELKDTGTMFDILYKRASDTIVWAATASQDDPDDFLGGNFTTGQARNFSEFSDERIEKWFEEQAQTLDVAKRKEIVLNMQRRMHELVPASMLWHYVRQTGRWRQVRNFTPGVGYYNNLKFQDVWLAK